MCVSGATGDRSPLFGRSVWMLTISGEELEQSQEIAKSIAVLPSASAHQNAVQPEQAKDRQRLVA